MKKGQKNKRKTDETRSRIMRSVAKLIAENPASVVTVPEVAKAAGVSIPTIYRYFPNRRDLIETSALEMWEGKEGPTEVETVSLTVFGDHLKKLWRSFEADLPSLIAIYSAPAGRELRAARNERRRRVMRAQLKMAGFKLSAPETKRLETLLLLIESPVAFMELNLCLGVHADEAAEMIIWAMRQLRASTLREMQRTKNI